MVGEVAVGEAGEVVAEATAAVGEGVGEVAAVAAVGEVG